MSDADAAAAVEAVAALSGDGPPPTIDQIALESSDDGGYSSIRPVLADVFAARREGLLDAVFESGRVRYAPSDVPTRPGRFSAGHWDIDRLARSCPEKHSAIRSAHGRMNAFDRIAEHADFERWADAVVLMDNHGIDPTTPHEDQIVCRECGGVAGRLDDGHLDEHGLTPDEYRRFHPAAPLSPRGRSEFPPARLDW